MSVVEVRRVYRAMRRGETLPPGDEPTARRVLGILGGSFVYSRWYRVAQVLLVVWAVSGLAFGHGSGRFVFGVLVLAGAVSAAFREVRWRRMQSMYGTPKP